jgi:hypothetical protein
MAARDGSGTERRFPWRLVVAAVAGLAFLLGLTSLVSVRLFQRGAGPDRVTGSQRESDPRAQGRSRRPPPVFADERLRAIALEELPPGGEGRPLDPAGGGESAAAGGREVSASFASSAPPTGDLSISGSVLDETGAPVADVPVLLLPERAPRQPAPGVQAARTPADGRFTFRNLPEGGYELRSPRSERFALASLMVRAGVDSAVLVLRRLNERVVRVEGMVATRERRPIAQAQVLPAGQKARGESDAAGHYQLDLVVKDENPSLRFRKEGYRDQQLSLAASQLQRSTVHLDVLMEPLEREARVAGALKAPGGAPVAGATVMLSSGQRRRTFRTGSDLEGMFVFPKVEVGSDYRLWIRPKVGFADHLREGVTVTERGLELNVVLERQQSGSIAARLLDSDGAPLAGFSMWLRSAQASAPLRVVADQQGTFSVESLPAGRLSLETAASPLLSVSGIEVPAGGRQNVDITLDCGNYQIAGQVSGPDDRPVPGSEVSLFWLRQEHGVKSQSQRKTITDRQGHFQFTRLGRGPHALAISASGYHSARREVPTAGASAQPLLVRLESR